MIRLIMVVLAIGSVSFVSAAEKKDPCLWVSTISESIMKARQDEKPMAKVIAVFDDEKDIPLKSALRKMVISAYEVPGYSGDENKSRAVSKFQNEMYLGCVKEQ